MLLVQSQVVFIQHNRKMSSNLYKIVTALAFTTAILIEPSHAQDLPESPCSAFQYDASPNEPGRWYGTVTLNPKNIVNGLNLNIILDRKADLLGNWIGDVSSRDNTVFTISNNRMIIYPDMQTQVKFYVKFNVMKATPRLKGIMFDGVDICRSISFPTRAGMPPKSPPTSSPPVSQNPVAAVDQDQCGKVRVNNINPLILGGKQTGPGDWPWHIALIETSPGLHYTYICGGTLVSHLHVITAAHCVTRPTVNHPRPTKDVHSLTVITGAYNLQIFEGEFKFVSNIIRHPRYNSQSLVNDLAILKLRDSVQYSTRVQPACLWPEDQTDSSFVVGKTGSVVGWGKKADGALNPELSLVTVPVVSAEVCLRSHPTFFANVTSEFTLCAGNPGGASPCNGDSGGGMVFKMANTWYLRGLVSLSKKNSDGAGCDPNYYVVFTDIAKYLPWVKENIV